MSDLEDDDLEIDEVPQDLELDEDLEDEHEARWRLEHSSVYADIECDLDESDYPISEPVVVLTREAELLREMIAAVGLSPTPEAIARWRYPRRPIIRRLAA